MARIDLPPPRLLPRVLELIETSPMSRREIACKLDMSEHWVGLLVNGRIKNPGVNTIEALYYILTGQEVFPNGKS